MSPSAPPNYLKWPFLLLAAVLPWSVELPVGLQSQISFPSELIIGLLAILLVYYASTNRAFRPDIYVAPVLIWLGWGWITAVASTMPVTSMKYMLVTSTCVWVFLFPARQWPTFFVQSVWMVFVASMSLAVLRFCVGFAATYHWNADQAVLPAIPFFDDHNQMAATAAFASFIALFLWQRAEIKYQKLLLGLITVVLFSGVLLSTSRGAIFSVLLSILVLFTVKFYKKNQIKGHIFTSLVIIIVALVLKISGGIILEKVQQDVSSMERWNKYNTAFRMAKERPVWGFGPGTFPVQYIPFQAADEMTRISLSAPIQERNLSNLGRGGNAHSEYLSALAETGWPGLVLFGLIFAIFITQGSRLTSIVLEAGLVSFLTHGLVNSFIHNACIAFLVWSTLGIFSGKSDRQFKMESKV